MLVNNIIGNITNFNLNGKSVDKVNLSADDRLKQVLRLKSQSGVEIGVNLTCGHLHNGDILAQDDNKVYVIDFLPQAVILIKPKDIMQMGFVAHSIGNKHIPAIFEDDCMIIEDDYLIVDWLKEANVVFEQKEMVLRHALKHASHHH